MAPSADADAVAERIAHSQSPAAVVAAWNDQYPVETPVEYLAGDDVRCGRTRSRAVVRDGIAQVLVTGCGDMVDLANVRPLKLGVKDQIELDEFNAAVDAVSGTLVRLELDALAAVALIGALQLVLRHPLIGRDAGPFLRGIALGMQEQLPEPLRTMAEHGWNSEYDALAEPVELEPVPVVWTGSGVLIDR